MTEVITSITQFFFSVEKQDVREVFTRVISSLEAPGVNIRVEVQGLCIYADLLFEKVCYNLIENATHHGEHTTEIIISTQKIPTGVRVSVKDNGAGIPEAEKQIIFEKGYGKNTGFGLFLTREILSLSNIHIRELVYPDLTPGLTWTFLKTMSDSSPRIKTPIRKDNHF